MQEPHDWNFGLIESQKNELNVVMGTIEQKLFANQINDGTYTPRFHVGFIRSEEVSKWPLVAFLMTALVCLGASTLCHWFWSKHPKLCIILTTLDYWGITLLILGTSYPFISYRFACGYMVVYRYVFVCLLTIITILCMVVTMNPTFLKPAPKIILFVSFGLFNFIPTIALYALNDREYGLKPSLAPFTWSTLSYLTGMTLFALKFPERMSKTGRFDIFPQSHNIHHICVLLGLTFSLVESFDVYE